MMRNLLACILLLGASSAFAEDTTPGYFLDGNQLHDMCRTSRSNAGTFVMGFADGFTLKEEMGGARDICVPFSAKSVQLTDIVCQFLEANPTNRHMRAAYQVHSALVRAWPCQ